MKVMSLRKKNLTTTSKSVIINLRDKGIINDKLLVLINNLKLEDLIALKLELACNDINNRLYGFDIWRKSNHIVKEALLKFALSTTKSKRDAARFLGLNYKEFQKLFQTYEVDSYF